MSTCVQYVLSCCFTDFFIYFRFIMNRLLSRRCSMSSIEEEDESVGSEELITQIEKTTVVTITSTITNHINKFVIIHHLFLIGIRSYRNRNKNLMITTTIHMIMVQDQAADRALQGFVQSCSQTVSFQTIFIVLQINLLKLVKMTFFFLIILEIAIYFSHCLTIHSDIDYRLVHLIMSGQG